MPDRIRIVVIDADPLLNFQRSVLAKERQNMIADCKRPIVAGRYQSQSHVQSARPGAFWFYAGAVPLPRGYGLSRLPFLADAVGKK
jgi:hypothetical protein